MQGEPGGDDIERGASDFSAAAAGALEDKGLYLGSEAGAQYAQAPGVTAWGGGAAPPQPSLQDPSPRRRGTLQSTPVQADSASAPRAPAAPASETATARRGQMVRELAPLLHAVAGLTHETNLGKLVRQLHAVVLMLAQADACRVCLFDAKHRVLQLVPPGDQADAGRERQFPARGVTGLAASSGTAVNVDHLQAHGSFDALCDLGDASLGAAGAPRVSALLVPCRDKADEVVAVVAAVRMGAQALPFGAAEEDLMELLASQAGVALALAQQRAELTRGKWQSKVLTKAAVELGARAEQDAGSLALLTSVYAKKLCEADSASVFLTYNGHRVRALWDSTLREG